VLFLYFLWCSQFWDMIHFAWVGFLSIIKWMSLKACWQVSLCMTCLIIHTNLTMIVVLLYPNEHISYTFRNEHEGNETAIDQQWDRNAYSPYIGPSNRYPCLEQRIWMQNMVLHSKGKVECLHYNKDLWSTIVPVSQRWLRLTELGSIAAAIPTKNIET
jgi:hypothetical protein